MRGFLQIIFVFALLASSVVLNPGLVAQGRISDQLPASQASPEPPGIKIFMPIISRFPVYALTGQVKNFQGAPVAGVNILDKSGRSATTDANGNYSLGGLGDGSYALAPGKSGLVFSPSIASVNLPGGTGPLNFNAYQQCPNFVVNDSFETDQAWQRPITEYTANYTTEAAHTGVRAMRTGITNPAQNKYSYSSTRQPILIPAGTTSAILRLWLYPMSGETNTLAMPSLPRGAEVDTEALGSDGQYVLVVDPEGDPYNPDTGELLETLLWMRSNNQQWGLYEFNLSKYASSTEDVWIKIQAGTYNDGYDGVTAMYVDDVTLELCNAGSAPTPPTPPAAACSNGFTNSDFELVDRGWSIPVTAFSARYSAKQVHSGVMSMRTGVVDLAKNIYSYSDAWQLATIPKGATSATLNMWVYQISTGALEMDAAQPEPQLEGRHYPDLALANDVSYILVLDQYGFIEETLYRNRGNAQTWTQLSFDLTEYAGRTIRIQFGTFNNGQNSGSGITAMYVDDAYLDVCTGGAVPGPTPTPAPTAVPVPTATPAPTAVPSPTPIPGACPEGFGNNGFELDTYWGIPITAFSAGYSTALPRTGVRSMRNGIVNSAHNRYSYSDAYQVTSMPLTVNTATVGMWIYAISGEVTNRAAEDRPTASLLSNSAAGNDVQYVLVLDSYGNWIDTLLWQRKNNQTWTYHTFDVSKWIGTTIRLQFGVYNDGWSGVTAMYVDDTTLQLCP